MRNITLWAIAPLLAVTALSGCGNSGQGGLSDAAKSAALIADNAGGNGGGAGNSGGNGGGEGNSGGSATAPPITGPRNCTVNATRYNDLAGDVANKASKGVFTYPFCEEKFLSDYPDSQIPDRGAGTAGVSNPAAPSYSGLENCKRRSANKVYECKPSAGSIALLPDNRMVYFNALEGTENVEFNVVKEFGDVSVNDQTRVLKLNKNGSASWTRPINNDGGAVNPTNNPTPGGAGNPLTGTSPNDTARNDGALFCAHLVNLYDGRVLAAGGTDYYTEAGAVELEGLKNTRIFNPANNTWTQAGLMNYGRWYPTMVTLANGNLFVVSGVRKLLKPVYADRPADSGRNETHTETFQIGCNGGKGKWTDNGATGQKSLPLFSRMHLLPNNQALFMAAGQAFNPFGQSYDQALWNIMSAYNPKTNVWTDLGVPTSLVPGFRGSTSNIMMPLKPDADGGYSKAEFLTMGGTIGLSPGAPQPLPNSRIDTISIGAAPLGLMTLSSRDVGMLNTPRWYGQGVLLPTGQVMLFSGADLDEVISPGSGTPIMVPELFDPVTETWTKMATQGKARTYHNTAFMLPDGRVMVAGHAPISNNYSLNAELPGKSPQGRDPSFEIYSPPYMFKSRPTIGSMQSSAEPGALVKISTPDAASIAASGYVVLVRRPAITHLVDGDQRNIVLKIESSNANTLSVRIPNNDASKNQAVVPPGYYMLFVVNKSGSDLVPSVSAPLLITGADLSCR